MNRKIKWGLIGLGNIAHQFVKDLLLVEDAELEAVASRDIVKAQDFANTYKAKQAFGSYQEIIECKDIDILYIATPHDSHCSLTLAGLNHGKHILCEKPIALNAAQTREMITAARSNGRFLMEAFWTRFNPSFRAAYQKIKAGELGQIKYVNADFAFHVPKTQPRMKDLNLGGGSLLDMGVYPVFLSYMVLGMPEKIHASAHFYDTGADQQTSMILKYPEANALLHSSFVSPSNMIATISGTEGRINLKSIWHETQSYELIKNNHRVEYHSPTMGKGFSHEIIECHQCIRNDRIESELWSHQNSLELIQIMDDIRASIGLEYSSDKPDKL
jgi:predicted dehydrogenase